MPYHDRSRLGPESACPKKPPENLMVQISISRGRVGTIIRIRETLG